MFCRPAARPASTGTRGTRPPVFDWLARHVDEDELRRVFNLGIGWCAVVSEPAAGELVIGNDLVIGVLVSGNGTNLQALIDARLKIAAVASNRKDAYALIRAREAGIPTATFSLDCHADRTERDLVMATWLEEHGVELVVLAGYMHLLTPPFLNRFPGRVVNVHPSLLPAFPGAHAITDAAERRCGDHGRHGALRRRGPRYRRGDPPGGGRGRAARDARGAHPCSRASASTGGGDRAVPRALISVYDKEGVVELARGLTELGWELVSSGGTAAHLEEEGLAVTRVEEVTGAPELLGGRVKTLHPNIHAGILARRDRDDDLAALAEQSIEPFDLVCVNLYPFASVSGRHDKTEDEIVELIDVGGPSMLRAAAKNFAHVSRRLVALAVRAGARRAANARRGRRRAAAASGR